MSGNAMETSLSGAPMSGPAIQRHTAVAPIWSIDSAQGALLWFGLTFLTGALGGLASSRAAQFYGALKLPEWAPPASVFGPVWSVLYLLMAVAAWLVWRHRHTVPGASGLLVYGVALVPNAMWSWLFFDWQLGLWALIDIGLLWLLVGFTVRAFWRVRPVFGLLMVPLWAWVSFAGVLNAVLWQTNPALLG
jgi:benzodiazapine receptor